MKTIQLLIAIIFVVIVACQNEEKQIKHYPAYSYELIGPTGKDTVNLIYDGKKEGHWVVKEHVKAVVSLCKDSTHREANKHAYNKTFFCVTEEGYYKNNLKEGLWLYYNTDGSVKDSVVYKNGEVLKN